MNCCLCTSRLGEHSPESWWSSDRLSTHSFQLPLNQCTQVINFSSKVAPAGLRQTKCQGCSRQMAACSIASVTKTAAHFQAAICNRLNGTGAALSVHHVKRGRCGRPDTAVTNQLQKKLSGHTTGLGREGGVPAAHSALARA